MAFTFINFLISKFKKPVKVEPDDFVDDFKDLNYTKFESSLIKISGDFDSNSDSYNKYFLNFNDELLKVMRNGKSRVEVFLFLRNKGYDDDFIKKLLSYKFLVKKFEKFVFDIFYDRLDEREIEHDLKKQEWISLCYSFPNDSKKDLKNILFLISGSKIYGFSEENFYDLFESDFKKALRGSQNVNFSDYISFNFNNIDSLKEICSKVSGLLKKVKELNKGIARNQNLSNVERTKLMNRVLDLDKELSDFLKR